MLMAHSRSGIIPGIMETKQSSLMLGFGQRLQELRRARGLTQNKLAEALQLRPITLSRWECGRRSPSLPALARAADVLGVSLAELLDAPTSTPESEEPEIIHAWRKIPENRRDLALRLLREVAIG